MRPRSVKLIFIFFSVFMVAGLSADRLGYLMTEFSFNVRAYVIFPFLILPTYGYMFFLKLDPKWDADGKRLTSHEVNLKRFKSRASRAKMWAGYLVGIPLILGFLAWLTIGIPAYLAKLVAREPFAHEFLYTPGAFIAKGFKFTDALTGEQASVQPTVHLYSNFPEDLSSRSAAKMVCLRGRTSVFGTIVTEIKLGNC
jgi:hypothetical protein